MPKTQDESSVDQLSFIPLTDKWVNLVWPFIEPEAQEMPKSWPKTKEDLLSWALGTKKKQTIADRSLILRIEDDGDHLNPVGIITGDLVRGLNSDIFPGAKFGDVNIAYFVFSKFRGQGIAQKALTEVRQAWQDDRKNPVLRIAPENLVSQAVANGAGFSYYKTVEANGREFMIFKPKSL